MRKISLCFLVVSLSLFIGLPLLFSAQPTLSTLDDLIYTKGTGATVIDSDFSVSGGSEYTEGSVLFSLTGASGNDQLVLGSASDPNASGAISVSGSEIYLGNGSGKNRIGSIDSTEDGSNGQNLLINFSTPLENAGFETGDTTGWTLYDQEYTEVDLDGLTTNYSYNNGTVTGSTAEVLLADSFTGTQTGDVQTTVVQSGTYALQLVSSGSIVFTNQAPVSDGAYVISGYGSYFGPYVVSSSFEAYNGDSLYFGWSAQNGGDSYDVFGYLVNLGADGVYGGADDTRTLLLSQRGDTQDWTTSTGAIPSDGTYVFEFICGTFDQSGGKGVGASLYIDNFRIVGSTAIDDSAVSNLLSQVTYENTSMTDSTDRQLSATVTTQSSHTDTATATITLVDPVPALALWGYAGMLLLLIGAGLWYRNRQTV